MLTPTELRNLIQREARALGCDLAGVAAVADYPELSRFAGWIAAGRGGEMAYLSRPAPAAGGLATAAAGNESGEVRPRYLREDVRLAFPWARSVVCCGLLYNTSQARSTGPGARDSAAAESGERGWISRYAWGDDYHEVLLAKMRRLGERLAAAAEGAAGRAAGRADEQRVYVDTGPILERVYAHHAGLGWLGKNTCLIHPRLGSYLFLGTLICSLEIAADHPLPDRCGSCTRCIEACPTDALRPYEMDARRCLAYLNIELRGAIPEDLRAEMGDNLIGCDICQDVCPWNRRAPVTEAAEFQPRPELLHPKLEELAKLDAAGHARVFRGSAAKRARFAGLRRNLAVAMGNSGNGAFAPRLRAWVEQGDNENGDPILAEHARWALRRLGELDQE